MRYGTVQIVRAVGGIADTVRDYAPKRPKATGFVFEDHTAAALMGALKRALELFKDQKKWRTLQLAGMRQDFSWDRSAAEYVKIYEGLLKSRSGVGRP
jgi:starch synthase